MTFLQHGLEEVSGADMRATVISLYTLLNEGAKQCILNLLYSVVKLSAILYSDEENKHRASTFLLQQLIAPYGALQRALSYTTFNYKKEFLGVCLHAPLQAKNQ